MAIDVEEYQKLKKEAEDLRSEVLRAEGSLQSLMASLKTNYDCSTIEEAETLLEKLTKEKAAAEVLFNERLSAYKAKFTALKNE